MKVNVIPMQGLFISYRREERMHDVAASAAGVSRAVTEGGGGRLQPRPPLLQRDPAATGHVSGAEPKRARRLPPQQVVGPYHFHPVLIGAALAEAPRAAQPVMDGNISYETLVQLVTWPTGTPMSSVATARSLVKAAVSSAAALHAEHQIAENEAGDDSAAASVTSSSDLLRSGAVVPHLAGHRAADGGFPSPQTFPSSSMGLGGMTSAEMRDIGTDDLSEGTLPSPSLPGSTHVLVLGTPPSALDGGELDHDRYYYVAATHGRIDDDDDAQERTPVHDHHHAEAEDGDASNGGDDATFATFGASPITAHSGEEEILLYGPSTAYNSAQSSGEPGDADMESLRPSHMTVAPPPFRYRATSLKDDPLSCQDVALPPTIYVPTITAAYEATGVAIMTLPGASAGLYRPPPMHHDKEDICIMEHRSRRCITMDAMEALHIICSAFVFASHSALDPPARVAFLHRMCGDYLEAAICLPEAVLRHQLERQEAEACEVLLRDMAHGRRAALGVAVLAPLKRLLVRHVYRLRASRAARKMALRRVVETEANERTKIERRCWDAYTANIAAPAVSLEEWVYRKQLLDLYVAVGVTILSAWVWLHQRCELFQICFASQLNGAPKMSGRVARYSLFHTLSELESWARCGIEAANDVRREDFRACVEAAWLATTHEPRARLAVEQDEEERRFLLLCVKVQVTRAYQRRDCEYDEIAARRKLMEDWATYLPLPPR